MEKLFNADVLSKRERVERALNHLPVDRVPLHEQLSYNPKVIAHYTQKQINGFEYDVRDIGAAVKASLDCAFVLCEPQGEGIVTTEDGFQYRADNWTRWHLSRPFSDEEGASEWLRGRIVKLKEELEHFNETEERKKCRKYMLDMQELVGETVLMNLWCDGFCEIYDKMGLEIFSYFIYEYEELFAEYMELKGNLEVKRAEAMADYELSPVVLIAEDFCSNTGPIFSPELLRKYHYPWIKKLVEAGHRHGLKVIYHTDGKFKSVIPELMECGVDGFYCLERSCDMHIEVLAREYPQMVWMGGVDGVYTMEYGSPEKTDMEVKQIIEQTQALEKGGIFIDSSSEINPSIPLESYLAMVNATDKYRNHFFGQHT